MSLTCPRAHNWEAVLLVFKPRQSSCRSCIWKPKGHMAFLPYNVNQSWFELGQPCWLELKLLKGRTGQLLPPSISVLLRRAEPPLGKGPFQGLKDFSMRPGRLHSFVGHMRMEPEDPQLYTQFLTMERKWRHLPGSPLGGGCSQHTFI